MKAKRRRQLRINCILVAAIVVVFFFTEWFVPYDSILLDIAASAVLVMALLLVIGLVRSIYLRIMEALQARDEAKAVAGKAASGSKRGGGLVYYALILVILVFMIFLMGDGEGTDSSWIIESLPMLGFMALFVALWFVIVHGSRENQNGHASTSAPPPVLPEPPAVVGAQLQMSIQCDRRYLYLLNRNETDMRYIIGAVAFTGGAAVAALTLDRADYLAYFSVVIGAFAVGLFCFVSIWTSPRRRAKNEREHAQLQVFFCPDELVIRYDGKMSHYERRTPYWRVTCRENRHGFFIKIQHKLVYLIPKWEMDPAKQEQIRAYFASPDRTTPTPPVQADAWEPPQMEITVDYCEESFRQYARQSGNTTARLMYGIILLMFLLALFTFDMPILVLGAGAIFATYMLLVNYSNSRTRSESAFWGPVRFAFYPDYILVHGQGNNQRGVALHAYSDLLQIKATQSAITLAQETGRGLFIPTDNLLPVQRERLLQYLGEKVGI